MAKDLFSNQADAYAKYRPTYPPELFDYILSFVNEKECAWDCATGNGQAALVLADQFTKVEATDLSEAQLKYAVQKENIHYQVSTAEQTPFADNSFDLITIATAYHWFDWKAFHKEATRVCKKNAVVAAWGYHVFFSTDENITSIIQHFYHDIIKRYWDKERQYVDDRYASVEFDFAPLPSKDFDLVLNWNKEGLLGYLSSWSAVQNYIQKKGSSPLSLIEEDLEKAWPGNDDKEFHFPLFLKIGRVRK
ncbi:MAG: class SAM-dependent methyltransferase [Flavisolibacter sp.]|jgi:SAM-dependent methyltransferase|nr:class SAM-dependent methyltransferase [Flavisolibacter sp.]